MNNTLNNGFKVLEYLAASGKNCSVKEIAEFLDLPPSHACRLLKTLTDTGYVIQIPGSRKYQIGLKILSLSCEKLANMGLRTRAHHELRRLADHLCVPVYLTQVEFGISVIVDTASPSSSCSPIPYVIGRSHSVNRSACGKLCAAYAEPELLRILLQQCDYTRTAPASIPDEASFLRELQQIRKQGYSVIANETQEGIYAAAAPVFAGGKMVGAVGAMLTPSAEKPSPEKWNDLISSLMKSAEQLSGIAENFYTPPHLS